VDAIDNVEKGLVDADLSSGLFKKRVARQGQGKRGSYRTILAFKSKDRTVFMFGFSKTDRENLDAEEKTLYKKLTKLYLQASLSTLEDMCLKGSLVEVHYEKK